MLIPLRDNVIIRRDKDEKSAGGIELLDSHKDPAGTEYGTVAVVNPSYYNSEGRTLYTSVKEEERVLFMRKHAVVIKGHKDLVAVKYDNLIAVLAET